MNTDFIGVEVISERSFAGTPDALAAARARQLDRLDTLEIAWRNQWRIVPDVPDWMPAPGNGMELFAIGILRQFGPACITVIRWALIHPCPRCWRQLTKRKGCRRCQSYGYTDDVDEFNADFQFEFYADLDGRIVEVR